MRPQYFFSIISLCALVATAAPPRATNYSNPVLPGDYPDPTIMRVGADYWASATCSEWAPIFPILHSRDLVHWQTVGGVFSDPPAWSAGKYWAPEISEYNKMVFVYYVAEKWGGPLCIGVATAPRPEGPYTDHGPIASDPVGAIDPMAFTEDSGERYLVWKEDGNSVGQPTPIFAQKLAGDGLSLAPGEKHELIRNDAPWEGPIVEGPFLLKRDGWYYLFYAGGAGCCGRGCQYGVGVARSKNLLGPYEKNPANPIVAANDSWRCTGHGSLVSDPHGNYYFLYHGYSEKGSIFIGRQGLLDKVNWTAAGWPEVNGGKGPAIQAPLPIHPVSGKSETDFYDDFTGDTLNPRFQWPRARKPSVTEGSGTLELAPSADLRKESVLGAILAMRTTSGNYAATALVDLTNLAPGVSAGLFAVGSPYDALGMSVLDGKIRLLLRRGAVDHPLAQADLPKSKRIYLRMTASDGHRFRFSYWTDEKPEWTEIGGAADLEGDFLPPWDLGVRVALTAGGGPARFKWLKVIPAN